MLIKKLLVAIASFIFIFQINAFALTDKEKIKQLEETVKKQEQTINQLTDTNTDLVKDNLDLNNALADTTKALEESTKALEDSTVLIAQQKERISLDQAEIIKLRDQIEVFIDLARSGQKNIMIGAGIKYPLGGEVIAEMFIPNFTLGFFVDLSLSQSDNPSIPLDFGVGGGIVFRF
jgi:hypothetical protein